MAVVAGTKIVKDLLTVNLDSPNIKSYSGTGSLWTELTDGLLNSTLTNITYSTDFGGIFDFNGTSSYLTFGDPSVGNTFSIEWMMRPGNQSSSIIVPQSNGTDNFINYDSVNQRFGISVCESVGTNQLSYYTTDNRITIDEWVHCVITMDNLGEIKMYINGFLNKTYAYEFTPSSWTGTWYVGQLGNSTDYYLGDITNIKVYNKVLDSNEVLTNFDSLRGRFGLDIIEVPEDIVVYLSGDLLFNANDISTMYQDTTKTTQVTTSGQTIGAMTNSLS